VTRRAQCAPGGSSVRAVREREDVDAVTLVLAIYGAALSTFNAGDKVLERRREHRAERRAEAVQVEVSFAEVWTADDRFEPHVVVVNRGRRRVWVAVIGAEYADGSGGFDDRMSRDVRPLDRDQSDELAIPPGIFSAGQTIVGFAELTTGETFTSEPLTIQKPEALSDPPPGG
jgi:hypothetical protein